MLFDMVWLETIRVLACGDGTSLERRKVGLGTPAGLLRSMERRQGLNCRGGGLREGDRTTRDS